MTGETLGDVPGALSGEADADDCELRDAWADDEATGGTASRASEQRIAEMRTRLSYTVADDNQNNNSSSSSKQPLSQSGGSSGSRSASSRRGTDVVDSAKERVRLQARIAAEQKVLQELASATSRIEAQTKMVRAAEARLPLVERGVAAQLAPVAATALSPALVDCVRTLLGTIAGFTSQSDKTAVVRSTLERQLHQLSQTLTDPKRVKKKDAAQAKKIADQVGQLREYVTKDEQFRAAMQSDVKLLAHDIDVFLKLIVDAEKQQ
mmetsp:Transcript_722/g.1129  ORF Transcript_722/g.1129 Transcript_722/m.1129 type:complete len:265 (+) Transcript_722:1317-2111(+)